MLDAAIDAMRIFLFIVKFLLIEHDILFLRIPIKIIGSNKGSVPNEVKMESIK